MPIFASNGLSNEPRPLEDAHPDTWPGNGPFCFRSSDCRYTSTALGVHMSGVEARGNSVRIYFQHNGEKCRESIPGGNTPAIVAQARRLVDIIEYEIQAGTFDYARHFPNSSKLVENTFGHYLDLWLKIKANSVAASSY